MKLSPFLLLIKEIIYGFNQGIDVLRCELKLLSTKRNCRINLSLYLNDIAIKFNVIEDG